MGELERYGHWMPDNTHSAPESDHVSEPHAEGFSADAAFITQLLESLETPWLGDGSHKPREMEQAAKTIRELLRDKQRCTRPCAQLIATCATVERLEDMLFRLQREFAGVECLVAGLEARR